MSRNRMMVLLATVVAVVLGAATTALAASPSASNHAAPKGNFAKSNKDFAGLVDIGGGRQMCMECQGKEGVCCELRTNGVLISS